ncbi:hypothetical protein MesoLj113c_40620 [Mesorhizobium sp. 113-3-9]|nr:hypothetical protein MesoLj113c_40620 [Mesorhizobium sp. 113-3-9]
MGRSLLAAKAVQAMSFQRTIPNIRDWPKRPQLRHPRAEQEQSSVAETRGSIPYPLSKSAAEQNLHRGSALKSRHGFWGLRRVASLQNDEAMGVYANRQAVQS